MSAADGLYYTADGWARVRRRAADRLRGVLIQVGVDWTEHPYRALWVDFVFACTEQQQTGLFTLARERGFVLDFDL